MQIDRRSMLAATAAAALVGPAAAKPREASGPAWYERAIIIDALGGLADPYAPDGQLRLSDRTWAEMTATGVTLLRDTVFPVGNVADPWGDYQKAVANAQNVLAANPDRLLLIRSAADILKAKRERKFGIIFGTQDSSMVGPELDRLAQLKKDGVMTVQLTYNNRNLAGDGALESANAGLSKLGRKTSGLSRRSCCSTSAMGAPGRWQRRLRRPSGRWSSAIPGRVRWPTMSGTPRIRRSGPWPTRAASSASISCRS
jgi:membrane dipeptidase